MVPPRPGRRRWWALGALSLSVLAIGLDGTVLSMALPTLSRELHASQSDLVWFSSGYLLVLAAAVLPVGLIGDSFGRRRLMLLSLVGFGAGSVTSACAPSPGVFLAGRLLQGLAGAGITVMALSALVVVFDDHERPTAVAVYQAANFIALPLGPLVGGWMLSHLWWGWVFLVNVPVVIVAIAALLAFVPESRASARPDLDRRGVVTSTLGLVGVIYGSIRAGDNGWGDPGVVAALVAGVALLVAFVRGERSLDRRGGRPLIAPALLRSPRFLWGAILAAVAGMALIGVLFAMPQYFQGVQRVDVFGSGLRLLPLIAGMVLGAGLAGRLAGLTGTKPAIVAGFAAVAAGSGVGATTGAESSTLFIAAWTAATGAGSGLALAAATATALSAVTAERSGRESAVVQAFNKAGAPLGTAIMGTVLVAVYRERLDVTGLPGPLADAARTSLYDGIAVAGRLGSSAFAASARAAFVDGLTASLIVAVAIAVLGALATIAFLPGRGGRSP